MRTTPSKPRTQPASGPTQNEGEGSRSAARRFNAASEKSAKSGDVERLAREAARALDGPEGDALRAAEAVGRRGATRPLEPSREALDRAEDEGMAAPPPEKKS